jgi:serine phosphatase RsbU (regulator of sigma subunit)
MCFAVAENVVGVVVGDVTGKGLEAATYTAEIKFVLRGFLRETNDPRTPLPG